MERWLSSINARGLLPYTTETKAYYTSEPNDVGSAKIRLRSTGTNTIHRFSLTFTHDEWDHLKEWVKYNLANGVLPFEFPIQDPRKNGQYMPVRFMVEKGNWYSNMQWNYEDVTVTFELEQQDG